MRWFRLALWLMATGHEFIFTKMTLFRDEIAKRDSRERNDKNNISTMRKTLR